MNSGLYVRYALEVTAIAIYSEDSQSIITTSSALVVGRLLILLIATLANWEKGYHARPDLR